MYAYITIMLYSIDVVFLNCTIVKSPVFSEYTYFLWFTILFNRKIYYAISQVPS
jgi:hypothetical protein